jgi:ethanolamine ammonia-lyase small subunit
MRSLQATTPARIGIGHAGGRYPTAASLKFREDLAVSKDAVHRNVAETVLAPLGLVTLQSRASSRREYLMNTRVGRFLDDPSREKLRAMPTKADVQLVASDGLSAEAFENNVPQMLPLMASRLRKAGLNVGSPLFVRWARVAILDDIGEILRPRCALILLGERPGLGISDSLSGYFEYEPCAARLESDRNVLCNIHRRGVPPTEAALMLAEALIRVLELKKSGMSVRFDFT